MTEITTIHDNFMKMKVNNKFSFDIFKNYCHMHENLVDKLFKFINLNSSGLINYKELCYSLCLICRGSMNARLKFLFRLLKNSSLQHQDENDQTDLTSEEIQNIFIYSGKEVDSEISANLPTGLEKFINSEDATILNLLNSISDYLRV